MSRTMTQTEPCGGCRAPVAIGRWTERSRYGNKPLCDHCAAGTGHFETETRFVGSTARPAPRPPLMAADECVRCRDSMMVIPGVTRMAALSGGPVCSHCAESGRIELRRQVPPTTSGSWAYVDRVLEWMRLPVEERLARAGYDDGEYRDVDVDDDTEVRFVDPYGEPVYGDDGVYSEDRLYAGRYWVDGWEERSVDARETWVGGVDWALR